MHIIRNSHRELPAQQPEAPTLCVVPHSAGTAFVWCSHLDGAAIHAIQTASILERKKLVRPGHSLEVLFIDGLNLRDGTECELHISTPEGGQRSIRALARLARWDDPDTPRALRLIASRFSHDSRLPEVLERYLAFISAWQAPSRVLNSFPEGAIVEIDADVSDAQVCGYAITTHGLRPAAIQPLLRSRGKFIIWLKDLTIRHLYLELSGALIRVNLEDTHLSRAAARPITGTPLEQDLVTELHSLVTDPSHELTAWAASQCRSAATICHEDATVDIRRAVRLPSQDVAIFVDLTGAAHAVGQFKLHAFAGDVLNIEVATRDTDGVAQQIILTSGTPHPEAGCYQLSWVCAGRHHSVWIRETDSTHPVNVTLARDFMPIALVAPELFPTVLYPLATAPDRHTAPGLVQVMQLGIPLADVCANVLVFAGDDLEALHRTILGLSLTSRVMAFDVQVCLFNPGVIDTLLVAAQEWSQTYHMPLKVACYSARTSEAQVVRHAFRSDRPRIFCRAGTVPRCSNWVSQVLETLSQERGTLLFANTENVKVSGLKGLSDTLISALPLSDARHWADRFVAAAVPPHSDPDLAPIPHVYTLEAFLLAQGLQDSSGGASVRLSSDVTFVHSGTNQRPDEFYAKLDAYSLQRARTTSLTPKRRPRHISRRMTA